MRTLELLRVSGRIKFNSKSGLLAGVSDENYVSCKLLDVAVLISSSLPKVFAKFDENCLGLMKVEKTLYAGFHRF